MGAARLWPKAGFTRKSFRECIWEQGERFWRDLPWRNTRDPYAILVSEVMLQQTQVSRVLGRWERFIARYPNADALAAASTAEVVELWQGLGYNRRALNLKRACEACSAENGGLLPATYEGLLALPGVGRATAAGVMAFAYGKPGIYLETNVRTVFIGLLFPEADSVSDGRLEPYVRSACSIDDPRGWYYALLDVGAHMKSAGPAGREASRRSASYARQSAFEGSRRQKRAEILRYVLEDPGCTLDALVVRMGAFEESRGRRAPECGEVEGIVGDLVREGFFQCREGRYRA